MTTTPKLLALPKPDPATHPFHSLSQISDYATACILADRADRESAGAVDPERVAQLIAHRACCGSEADPANGKHHGYCVVCGVGWPCEYAGKPPSTHPLPESEVRALCEAATDVIRALRGGNRRDSRA